MDFQFLEYTATPSEKHLGIVTVKAYGKIILRFKIIPNKDGTGYFVGCASYKMPNAAGGDSYEEAFIIDSNYENKQVNTLIMSNVKQFMGPSAFTPVAQQAAEQSNWQDMPTGNLPF
jgi:hypothetical protein